MEPVADTAAGIRMALVVRQVVACAAVQRSSCRYVLLTHGRAAERANGSSPVVVASAIAAAGRNRNTSCTSCNDMEHRWLTSGGAINRARRRPAAYRSRQLGGAAASVGPVSSRLLGLSVRRSVPLIVELRPPPSTARRPFRSVRYGGSTSAGSGEQVDEKRIWLLFAAVARRMISSLWTAADR